MAALKSSNLAAADYDAETKALTIQFKGGGVYTYHDVDEALYQDLLTAESPGRYFQTWIKDQHRFTRG